MNARASTSSLLAGLAIGLGVSIAGYLLAHAIRDFRAADRHVSVRGLSERAVSADYATWSIHFTVIGEDFEPAQAESDAKLGEMRQFLVSHGIADADIVPEQTVVQDRRANMYDPNNAPRYLVRAGLTVRTSNVRPVKAASLDTNRLVRAGILLEPSRPVFSFTQLNSLKPDMLAEATASARIAAEQFAKDSKSRVGAIREASQGVFSIDDAYPGDPEHGQGGHSLEKKVRVVTTISFFLE